MLIPILWAFVRRSSLKTDGVMMILKFDQTPYVDQV